MNRTHGPRGLLLGLVALALAAFPVMAQNGQTDVDALLKKVAALEARVGELEAERADNPASALEAEINSMATGNAYAGNELKVAWSNTTRHASEDKAFDIKIGGRVQYDFVFGAEDDDFERSYGPIGDYIEARRERVFISGTIYSNVFFKAQYDFAGSGVANWRDVYVGLKKVPVVGNIFIGQYKQPMSLDLLTSATYLVGMERAPVVEAFVPDRQTGIMFRDTCMEDDRLFWAISVYREADNTGDAFDDDIGIGHDGEWNFVIRLAFVAWEEEGGKNLLEIGASFNYRNPDEGVVRFRSRPNIHTPQGRVVDTNNGTGDILDADDVLIFQVEIALVLESFSAQAEFFYATVDSEVSGDPDFWGGYLQLSYYLTGEYRPYKKSEAVFSRVSPMHNFGDEGSGAWELFLRLGYLDLEDEAVTGGETWDITAGVNWHLNPNAMVRFNYVYSDTQDGLADGTSHWFGFRFQVDF
ncbi:MAG: hypothetical protein H6807_07990 [Planctomycetes bacterium]|nr:hypothetical protein [Planctomycetota bacterium]